MKSAPILLAFGKAVRRQRLRRGLSQEQLAFESGLHRTYISSVERGARNVSLLTIYRIATALQSKPKDFF